MERNDYKIYVEVELTITKEGKTIPNAIIWENGDKFIIDKILDVRAAASQKAGGIGTRYTCMIHGMRRYLFWEDPKWFVEVR